MKKCGYCGRENEDASTHCGGCGTELPLESIPASTVIEASQPAIARPHSAIACPHCGGADQLEPVVFPHRKFSWSVFFFGGILSVLFLNNSRPRRFHCKKCETSFCTRTTTAKVMLVLLVVWLSFIWLPFLVWLGYTLLT
jgi:hypothetical protein